MAESFRCPSCSAPLEFEGKPMQKCRFCGSNIIVPSTVIQNSSVFGGAGNMDFGDLSSLTGKALKIGEIQRLIQSGQKIYAIKLFRETFNVGLKEAKDAVDAMESGKNIDISGMQVKTSSVNLQSNAPSIAEIQSLLQGGNKIEAIKRFREMTGVGLKQAKDAVEAIERGENPDISKMQMHAANAPMNYQINAQNLAVAKKIGYTVGGSILGTVFLTMVLIIGIIAFAFYMISNSVNRAIDKSLPTNPPAATPQPLKSAAQENSIAQELLKFGGEGTGAGKFNDNRTIAVDADGKIYSADYSGGRIQVFDAAGNFQTQIMADTTRTVDALATDRKGNLFVLQGYDVLRINKETGENPGKYRVDAATDLAIGLDGKIYVTARFGGSITVLSADGVKLKTIQIGKDLNLENIQQIAVDGAGNLYLLEGRNSAIFKLSPDGKLLTRFGGRSNGPSGKAPKAMFSGTPDDLAIDSQGRLYVSQISRLSVFDSNGNFLNDFKTAQAFGIALNDKDELFVASRPFVVKYKVSF